MQLETSTSSLDTQMAKENAIKQVVTSGKESLNQLGSWITANAAKATLFTALTFTAPAAFWQKADIAKNEVKSWETYKPVNSIDTAKNTVKIGDEPIKDSVEYKKERERLLKRWEEVQKELARSEKELEQAELAKEQSIKIWWPLDVFLKMKQEWREISAQDVIWANGRIKSFRRTEWLPEYKEMAEKTIKILEFIAANWPQQVITKND